MLSFWILYEAYTSSGFRIERVWSRACSLVLFVSSVWINRDSLCACTLSCSPFFGPSGKWHVDGSLRHGWCVCMSSPFARTLTPLSLLSLSWLKLLTTSLSSINTSIFFCPSQHESPKRAHRSDTRTSVQQLVCTLTPTSLACVVKGALPYDDQYYLWNVVCVEKDHDLLTLSSQWRSLSASLSKCGEYHFLRPATFACLLECS